MKDPCIPTLPSRSLGCRSALKRTVRYHRQLRERSTCNHGQPNGRREEKGHRGRPNPRSLPVGERCPHLAQDHTSLVQDPRCDHCAMKHDTTLWGNHEGAHWAASFATQLVHQRVLESPDLGLSSISCQCSRHPFQKGRLPRQLLLGSRGCNTWNSRWAPPSSLLSRKSQAPPVRGRTRSRAFCRTRIVQTHACLDGREAVCQSQPARKRCKWSYLDLSTLPGSRLQTCRATAQHPPDRHQGQRPALGRYKLSGWNGRSPRVSSALVAGTEKEEQRSWRQRAHACPRSR